MTAERPPSVLTARSKAVWRKVLDEFELSAAELELLRLALESLDRADQAAAIVAKDGPVVVDRYGAPKAHPACDIESRSRALYARFVQQLGVKDAVGSGRRTAKPGPRPRLASVRGA